MIAIGIIVVLGLLSAATVCVGLALFTDDAVTASGCIEEGQTW
jgi:hypothetical protein